MELSLPLDDDDLPASVQKFARAGAPMPARMMAAKGLVPVRGADLLTLLVQLTHDSEEPVVLAATGSLLALPDAILLPACSDKLHAAVLHALAQRFAERIAVLQAILQNRASSNATVAAIAKTCNEELGELIAVNHQRLLAAPSIIEALYHNPKVRMSTADRLIELAARHGLELSGIAAYQAHVEAIRGQLIPEPTDEPLPGDSLFAEALQSDESVSAIEIDPVDGTETVLARQRPLIFRIRDMSISERIRFAVVGDAAARSILVRDVNRLVSHAAISSPRLSDGEALAIAQSREVSEDILRYIGNKRSLLRSYEIKRALAFNPKTPVAIAMGFVGHMRPNDLRTLSRSRGISAGIKRSAIQKLSKKKT